MPRPPDDRAPAPAQVLSLVPDREYGDAAGVDVGGRTLADEDGDGVYDVGDLEQIKKYNNITWDPAGRITDFEEKPKVPRSTKTAICLYYYPRQSLPLSVTRRIKCS